MPAPLYPVFPMGSQPVESEEQRRVRLYSRGLNKTLATPLRPMLMRRAVQEAQRRHKEILPPDQRTS